MKTLKEIKELAKNYNFVAVVSHEKNVSYKVYTASEKAIHSIAAACLYRVGNEHSEEVKNDTHFYAVPKKSSFWQNHKIIDTAAKFYSCAITIMGSILPDAIELDPKDFYLSKTYVEFALIYYTDSKTRKKMIWKGEINFTKMIIGIFSDSGCKDIKYKKVTNQDECSRYVSVRLTNKSAFEMILSESVVEKFKTFDNSNFEL